MDDKQQVFGLQLLRTDATRPPLTDSEQTCFFSLLSELKTQSVHALLDQDKDGKETRALFVELKQSNPDVAMSYQNQEDEICGGIDKGDEYYEILLGNLYTSGDVIEREDPFRAAKWFLCASLKGNPNAMLHFADLIENQEVFHQDQSLAPKIRQFAESLFRA